MDEDPSALNIDEMAVAETPILEEIINVARTLKKHDRPIKIYIGEDSRLRPFSVQESILAGVSTYFASDAWRERTFKEAINGELEPKEDDPDVWHLFLHWLIKHQVDFIELANTYGPTLLVRSVCFAEKYGILEFQDDALIALVEAECDYSPELMGEAFEGTTEGHPLRTLVAERAVYNVAARKLAVEDLAGLDGLGFFPLYLDFREKLIPIKYKESRKFEPYPHKAEILHRVVRGSRLQSLLLHAPLSGDQLGTDAT